MSSWRSKLAEGLLMVVIVAVAARAVWALLGPLLPGLFLLLVVGGLVMFILRSPRSGGGPFHK
jgi:NhaP-type Na+/H+ or K+/H+ antiporter